MKYNKNLNYTIIKICKDYLKEDNKKINLLLDDFYDKDICDVLDYLLVLIYEKYKIKNIKESEKNSCYLEMIKLKVDGYDSIEKLDARIKWLKEMDLLHPETGLKENHELILNIFDELNLLLNDFNIDYYHTSGLLVYLLTNKELERFHHDLDIFVNEQDLENLKRATKKSNFSLNIFLGKGNNNITRRAIKLYYKQNVLPVSVFAFERKKDGSVYVNDYFLDENGNFNVTRDYNSPKCVELSFKDDFNYHNNIAFKSITKEALYSCKIGKRPKDIYDSAILKPYVDDNIVNELKEELKKEFIEESYDVPISVKKLFKRKKEHATKK